MVAGARCALVPCPFAGGAYWAVVPGLPAAGFRLLLAGAVALARLGCLPFPGRGFSCAWALAVFALVASLLLALGAPPLPSPPRTFRSLSPRSPRLQCAARGFLPCYVSCALLFSLLFLPFLTAPCVLTRLAAPPGLGDGLLGLRALTCGRPRVYLAACPALGLDFACSARRSALPPSSPPSFPAPFGA